MREGEPVNRQESSETIHKDVFTSREFSPEARRWLKIFFKEIQKEINSKDPEDSSFKRLLNNITDEVIDDNASLDAALSQLVVFMNHNQGDRLVQRFSEKILFAVNKRVVPNPGVAEEEPFAADSDTLPLTTHA